MRAGSVIRPEWPSEGPAIARLITAAFASAPHSGGNEADIVDVLRASGDLALSLVATDAARIIGHAALSPVTIGDGTAAWLGLGPVAVLPEVQGQGVGSRLIRDAIARTGTIGAGGIVVFGDPGYYGRFGFAPLPKLDYPGAPPGYFQALVLTGPAPQGIVTYSPAFA